MSITATKIEQVKKKLYELQASEKQLNKQASVLGAELKALGLDVENIPEAIAALEKTIKKNQATIDRQLAELEDEYKNL